MGCDIHLYVENQDSAGCWWKCNEGFRSTYYDPKHHYFKEDQFKNGDQPYGGRNYTVFAYLADVRNSGGSVESYCDPKGFPEDGSLANKEEYEKCGRDAHSASWFTLKELKDAYKVAKANKSSHVDLGRYVSNFFNHVIRQLNNWQKKSYCGGDKQTDDNIRVVFWFDN